MAYGSRAERKRERSGPKIGGVGAEWEWERDFLKAVERRATKSGRSHPLTKKVT